MYVLSEVQWGRIDNHICDLITRRFSEIIVTKNLPAAPQLVSIIYEPTCIC